MNGFNRPISIDLRIIFRFTFFKSVFLLVIKRIIKRIIEENRDERKTSKIGCTWLRASLKAVAAVDQLKTANNAYSVVFIMILSFKRYSIQI